MPQATLIENPGGTALATRKRKRSRRNPTQEIQYYNPAFAPYLNPANPGLSLRTITHGSGITQDVSVTDIFFGAASFYFNDWVVKNLDLKGLTGVIAAAIVPFISASVASMMPKGEAAASAIFLGGEMQAALRVLGQFNSPLGGLQEGGLFTTAPKLLSSGLGSVGSASKLIDMSRVNIPVDMTPRPSRTVRNLV